MVLVCSTGGFRDRVEGSEFAITSYVEDLTLASNEATAANIAATLGTLIKVLIEKGVINGTVNT